MRSAILFTLLSLWIFAIMVPSVITMLDNGDKTIMVMTLNEEEQQEQGKKEIHEIQMVCSVSFCFTLSFLYKDEVKCTNNPLRYPDHTQEIHLPPPEPIV